jgi:hypothetical protein
MFESSSVYPNTNTNTNTNSLFSAFYPLDVLKILSDKANSTSADSGIRRIFCEREEEEEEPMN